MSPPRLVLVPLVLASLASACVDDDSNPPSGPIGATDAGWLPGSPGADGGPDAAPGSPPPGFPFDAGGAAPSTGDGSVATPPTSGPPAATDLAVYKDPGSAPWQPIPEAEVAAKCKLDPAKLKGVTLGSGFAVVRYGQLCWDSTGGRDTASDMWSATKTLGAVVTGIASYETRNIPRTGKKTGQLKDSDEALQWLDSVSYNRAAHVAHVLAMVGHNADLSYPNKRHSYDTVGSVQINTLSTMVTTAIRQDTARLGSSTAELAKKFLFDAIGMTESTWPGTVYAYTWSATLGDMARLGNLILHQGVWSGRRILDAGWTYKMTHPAFEDGNTAYGYLTWLVAKEGQRSIGGGSFTSNGGSAGGLLADACSPSAVWQRYPHGLSEAPDCTYKSSPCAQKHDVGVWSAQGLGGQFIIGHPGLDLVIVAKNFSGGDGPAGAWNAIRPALVALDGAYPGNDAAFCNAYAAGDYAPDLPAPIMQPAE
jgi:hypothetical protein